MVRQDAGHHRFADRHGADADARVVAALGDDLGIAAVAVDGLARRQDRRGRLHGEARDDRLAGGDAAENAAGMVRQEHRAVPSCPMRISSAFSSPVSAAAPKPAPISTPLTALMLISARGEVGVELAVDRRAEPGRHAFGDDLDHGADGGAGLADAVEIVSRRSAACRIGAEERIPRRPRPSPSRAVDRVRTHLHQRAADGDARDDLRAIAPAATRVAVSRAEERPPPR